MFSLFFVHFFGFFRVWGAVNKSAASAASPDYVKFQAVIKSAASAASPIQGTQVQGSAGRRGTVGRRGRPDDGTGLGRRIGRSPSKSQGAGMVLDDFLSGIPI